MFWTTWLVESWKRKEAVIGHKWLMRDFQDKTTERSEFKATLDVDVQTKKKWMVSVKQTYLRSIFVGIPVASFFVLLVILVQGAQRYWRDRNDAVYMDEATGKPAVPIYLKYLPSVFNSVAIGVFGTVYKKVALWLAENENHRQQNDFENSLVGKIYMFQFINAYISNYIFAFYYRDFYKVAYNLVIIIVCIQVGNNVVEWATDFFLTSRKINGIATKYSEKIG